MPIGGAFKSINPYQTIAVQSIIEGGDESSWATISDLASVCNDGPNPLDFLIFRGFTGYGDDQQYVHSAKLAKDVVVLNKDKTPRGALLWGAYMFLGYGTGSAPGDAQAGNFWSLIDPGGSHYWQIPPTIDCERETFIANGVRQYVPLPEVHVYLDTKLMPAIEYLEGKTGRLPIIYANPDMIQNYLKQVYGDPKYAKLFQCPLWLALWSINAPAQNIEAPYWPVWAFWQRKGDISTNPGTTDIDYNEWPGDRASLKAWLADPKAPIPTYTTTTPPVVTPPVVTPPVVVPPAITTTALINVANLKVRLSPDTTTETNRIGTGFKGATFTVAEKKQVGKILFVRPSSPVWMAASNGVDPDFITLTDKTA